ncbi:MAG: DUF1284 domain-containing protein [Defluviitaleaceae bacterium]|nr:DUF1284 domain-containing protein [Defluviitaleaceae bacterium]
MKIRAHHLLCMQGFQGYGYNSDFVAHLGDIVAFLRANPGQIVQIVDICDDICDGCPHAHDKMCMKDDGADGRIKSMDKDVLAGIRVCENATMPFSQAIDLVNTAFKAQHDVEHICGNCGWHKECLWYISLEKW